MKTKWLKTRAAAVCALAIAVTAQAFPWKGGDASAPVLTQDQMWMGWKTCPNGEGAYDGQPNRMAGEVTSWIKQSQGQGYWMDCNGTSIAVLVQGRGMQKVSLPSKNGVFFVLGTYKPSDGNGYIEEAARFPLDGSAGVTEDEWYGWLDEAGYEYAVENAFRRLAVAGENGKRMPALDAVGWEMLRDAGKNTLVTDKADILKFLDANPKWWKQAGRWCAANMAALLVAAGIVVILLIIVGVTLFVNRPRCPKCGHLLKDCICGTQPPPPARCPRCGRPVAECICGVPPPPPPPLCPHCGMPKDQCVCTQPVCKGCGNPKDQCTCTQPPPPPVHGTTLLIDGVPLEQSEATVVLSPYALKVAKGGNSAGLTLPLPKMATVLGREKGKVPGAFIYLDMSDRKAEEKQCSRKYAKITVRGDALDVEVVATSGNDVRVDGQSVSAVGEVLQAKEGSVIGLNPDWEFEVVSAKAKA